MKNIHFTHKIKLETTNTIQMKKISKYFENRLRTLKDGTLYFYISEQIYEDIYFFIDISARNPIQENIK